jgi:hypothetical protein
MTQKDNSGELEAQRQILDLVAKKCDSAKKDLEKNWTYQIFSVGASLGLICGLGKLLSKYYTGETDYQYLLYLIAPLVNFYLFARFGPLCLEFAKARVALEILADKYFQDAQVNDLFDGKIQSRVLSDTSSYFEYYHKPPHFGFILYMSVVLIVFATSHTASIHLLRMFFARIHWPVDGVYLYLAIVFLLYLYFYQASKEIDYPTFWKRVNLVQISIGFCIVWTTLFLYMARAGTFPDLSTAG